ncbi:MAG TPA: aminotransferase class IV, partial [Kiloniellales bacterium]|nr:aminotransferase class IV [Kiloniellales bacterium]
MQGIKQDLSKGVAFVRGNYVPIDEASIPILDLGFTRSDATYDVVHVWNGRFFRLNEHLDRFERSVAKVRMTLPVTRAALREVLRECVRRSGLRDAYVEMICTRGRLPPGSRDPRRAQNSFYAFAIPFVWIADREKQKTGLALRISAVPRIHPASVDPTAKNFHWFDFTRGLLDAFDKADETAVLTDGRGNVVEGPGFNIFIVKDGRLATPAAGMLEGITRRTIIELARAAGREAEERSVGADEVRRADEVFATSTAGGVMPITRVDGVPVGDGRPGTVTLDLHGRYWQAHADPAWSEA